jgi:rhomboid protease GluP
MEAKKNEEVFTKKKPYVTILLIALNVLAFIFVSLYGLEGIGTDFGLHPLLVRNGQIYRLITSVFLHANAIHLLLNMYALYIIGSQIESFFGSFKYLAIYIFGAITGSLLSMAFLGNNW